MYTLSYCAALYKVKNLKLHLSSRKALKNHGHSTSRGSIFTTHFLFFLQFTGLRGGTILKYHTSLLKMYPHEANFNLHRKTPRCVF